MKPEVIFTVAPDGFLPSIGTEHSVGYDIYAAETVALSRHAVTRVRTGLILIMPPNMEAQVRTKSGLAARGIVVANSPGTIDPDYSGEIIVLLTDLTNTLQSVSRGQKIAQIVFSWKLDVTAHAIRGDQTTVIAPPSIVRGDGGFGSTGA